MFRYLFFLIWIGSLVKIFEGNACEDKYFNEKSSTYQTQKETLDINEKRSCLSESPYDVIFHIVKYLEGEDFRSLCVINHSFFTFFQNECFLKSYLPFLSGYPKEYKHRLLPAEEKIIPSWGSLFQAAKDKDFSDLFNNSYFELKKLLQLEKASSMECLNQASKNLNLVPLEISRATTLKNLYFSRNNLKELPLEFYLLKNLEELSLDGNQLCTFPSSICHITTLKKLSMKGNKIQYIPDDITYLVNLKYLILDGNNIQKLSNNIASLFNLERLYLNRNQIQEILVLDIEKLNNLKYLGLMDNPLKKGFETLETLKQKYKTTVVT